ncbi:MAG: IS1182 family transposase [Gemmatimonadetes bacterium]|nr:IS1182 family transposase [Gemmatimonadota bacterium]
MQRPDRQQIAWEPRALDALLPAEHRARVVWAFVEQLDLSALYRGIAAVEGEPGRPPIDPQILVALWLYATLEGVGSARALDRLCTEHVAYQWLCGGVGVNYHTLADFRVQHAAELDQRLVQSVAALWHQEVVDCTTVMQDGLKVRASAGTGSFRRKRRLRQWLQVAQQEVERLRAEVAADPGAGSRREQAAREREARVRGALAALAGLERLRAKQRPHPRGPARASTTDPDARLMRMSDGGYRPAYNVQLATTRQGRLVVGVGVTTAGSDMGQLAPMVERLQSTTLPPPQIVVADGDYGKKADIERVSGPPYGCTVIIPVQRPANPAQDPFAPRRRDPPAIAAWRRRMGTRTAQALYRERSSVSEWIHAQARNRGLIQVRVRGRLKVLAVALWHALANNLLQGYRLLQAPAT